MLFLVKKFVLAYNKGMLAEQKVIHLLIDTKKTLAVAESCTGGLLTHRLTNIPGASDCLKFSIVSYSNDAKKRFFKVPSSTLKKHGAVSEQCAIAMAKTARHHFDSDFALSITGIAGPSGGSEQKPVGLTYIAVRTKKETLCLKCRFKGTRKQIKKQAATEALNLLLEFLE